MFYLIPAAFFVLSLGLFLLFYFKPQYAKGKWMKLFYICLLLWLVTAFMWGISRNFSPPDWAK